HRLRSARVDADDARVRVRTAQDLAVELPGRLEVVGEAARADEQAMVLGTLDRLADPLPGACPDGHLRHLPRGRHGLLDRVDDLLVAGAAADIADQLLADLLARLRRAVAHDRAGGH